MFRWNFWADAELQAYNLTALQLPGWESYCCNTQLDANQALKYLTTSYNSWHSPLYQSSHIAEQERSKSIPIVQNIYMKSRAKPKKSSVCFLPIFWYFSTMSVTDVRGISEISQRASSNNGSITQSSPLWKRQIGEPFDSESKRICCQFERGNTGFSKKMYK